jgi:hypothetical protein
MRRGLPVAVGVALLAGCGSSSKARRDEESRPDNDGPLAEVTLPVVVGLTEAQAVAKLDKVDLIAVVEHARSKTVPAGRVIDQQPTAGNGEDPDSRILITVSSG